MVQPYFISKADNNARNIFKINHLRHQIRIIGGTFKRKFSPFQEFIGNLGLRYRTASGYPKAKGFHSREIGLQVTGIFRTLPLPA
jgi:hypothetical protein